LVDSLHWFNHMHEGRPEQGWPHLSVDAEGQVEEKTIPAAFPALARVLEKWRAPMSVVGP
jgi:hypothetical protein